VTELGVFSEINEVIRPLLTLH